MSELSILIIEVQLAMVNYGQCMVCFFIQDINWDENQTFQDCIFVVLMCGLGLLDDNPITINN